MILPDDAYIDAVKALVPLAESDFLFAKTACRGGIPPARFAFWLRVTASPSVAFPNPLGAGRSKNPLQVHESLEGDDFGKERV